MGKAKAKEAGCDACFGASFNDCETCINVHTTDQICAKCGEGKASRYEKYEENVIKDFTNNNASDNASGAKQIAKGEIMNEETIIKAIRASIEEKTAGLVEDAMHSIESELQKIVQNTVSNIMEGISAHCIDDNSMNQTIVQIRYDKQ